MAKSLIEEIVFNSSSNFNIRFINALKSGFEL